MDALVRKKPLKELLLESNLAEPKQVELLWAKAKGNVAQFLMFLLKKKTIERQKTFRDYSYRLECKSRGFVPVDHRS